MMENEVKRSHCEKIIVVDGIKTIKKKVPYDTLEEAIAQCKFVNIQPKVTEKNVPYKCTVCHKYHVGRNGKPITEKYRNKLKDEAKDKSWQKKRDRLKNATFKIVGKIDLSKIPKK